MNRDRLSEQTIRDLEDCAAMLNIGKPRPGPDVSAEPYCGQQKDLNEQEQAYLRTLIDVQNVCDPEIWRAVKKTILDNCVRISRGDRFLQALREGQCAGRNGGGSVKSAGTGSEEDTDANPT